LCKFLAVSLYFVAAVQPLKAIQFAKKHLVDGNNKITTSSKCIPGVARKP